MIFLLFKYILMILYLDLLMKNFAKILNHVWRMSLRCLWWANLTTYLNSKSAKEWWDFYKSSKIHERTHQEIWTWRGKASKTLMTTTTKLDKDEESINVDIKFYRSMIGSLLYLMASRSDIMFSVCLCARSNPVLKSPTWLW